MNDLYTHEIGVRVTPDTISVPGQTYALSDIAGVQVRARRPGFGFSVLMALGLFAVAGVNAGWMLWQSLTGVEVVLTVFAVQTIVAIASLVSIARLMEGLRTLPVVYDLVLDTRSSGGKVAFTSSDREIPIGIATAYYQAKMIRTGR